MPQLRLEESLSFEFYLLNGIGMVYESYGPKEPTRLVFSDLKNSQISNSRSDKPDEYYYNDMGPYCLRAAFSDQAKLFDHLAGMQGGKIAADLVSELEVDVHHLSQNSFRADFYPVYFEEGEYEALTVHGAVDTLPVVADDFCKSDIERIFLELYPKFEAPSLPEPETDDGENPAIHIVTKYIISEDDWQRLRSIPVKTDLPAFADLLYETGHAYRSNFHDTAQDIGKALLSGQCQKPDIILYASFYTPKETVPRPILPDPTVLRHNARESLLALNDSDYMKQMITKYKNPTYVEQVARAVEFLSPRLS